jgi:hypothetical protein
MLPEFQRTFTAGLLEKTPQGTAPGSSCLDTLGFAVHANNARVSLRIALEHAYPVTRRLVGSDFFTPMAEEFVASHPPNRGWLSAYGVDFADFVADYQPLAGLGYLADVARLEWARVRAANAPDDLGIDLKALAIIDTDTLEGLLLSLHAAASLVRSPFPVFDIWRAHQSTVEDDSELEQVDLAKGSQTVLVCRPRALEVGVTVLGSGDAAFLSEVARHSSFGAAYQAAALAEADYDLASSLGELVCLRALAALPGHRSLQESRVRIDAHS